MKPIRPTGKSAASEPRPAPKRAFKPRDLSSLMPGITREAFRKRSPASVTLFIEWREIIGPNLADRTEPRKLSAGTLTVSCNGPVAMEIQHMQGALISRINTWCGHTIVERLKLTQDFQAGGQKKPLQQGRPTAPDIVPVRVPDLPEGPLRQALEALGTRLAERSTRRR